MSGHLVRRGGIWWARLVVPERLRSAAGKREFNQSCQTHELAIAKLVCAVFLADWRRQIFRLDSREMSTDVLKIVGGSHVLAGGGYLSLDEAAGESGIDQNQLLRAVADGGMTLFSRLSQVRGHVVAIDEVDVGDIPQPQQMPASAVERIQTGIVSIGEESAAIAGALLTGGLEEIEIVGFYLVGQPGLLFVPDLVTKVKTSAFEVLAAEVEAMRQLMALDVLPGAVERAQALQTAALQGGTTSIGKKSHKRFSEALAAFAKHELPQSNKNPKEIERIRAGIGLFVELVGDLKLAEIDSDVLRDFRDGPLATVPARLNHAETHFKTIGKGIKATIAAIRMSGEAWPVMSAAERDQRMTWLGRMFRWLQGDWLKEDPSLALRGKSVLTKALRKIETQNKALRQTFNETELSQIFGQSWYQSGNGRATAAIGVNRKWSPFEFWLPLMSLHAGQRIRELCQLHLSDVRQTAAGAWYLDVNERTPDKSLKNGESQRVVPLHPILIEAGFIEWCDRLRHEGYRRVFPELSWEPVSGYSKEAKRRMSAMLNGLGMPRDNTKVFHSLRHTANNAFLRLELRGSIPAMIRLRVMGHKAGKDEGSTTYFSDFEADENTKFVALLHFNLPPIVKFDINEGIMSIREALNRKHRERQGIEDLGPWSGD